MTDIVFRIVGDGGGVDQAFDRVDKALDRVEQRSKSGVKALQAVTNQTAITRQESLTLSYTLSDIAASLASGASPFTILLQQGGQVKDSFGGIGPLFTKLASLITPARVGVGLLAAAIANVGIELYEGSKQSEEFAKNVRLSGNYAGVTASQYHALATSVAESAGATVASAKTVLQTLLATGRVGSESYGAVATAALAYAKASGQSAGDVAKDFASMTDGVSKWAAAHTHALNYLTAPQLGYLRQLESQGKFEQAARVNAELLTAELKRREPGLSSLGLLYDTVGKAASKAADAMQRLVSGSAGPVTDQVDKMKAQLGGLQAELSKAEARHAGATELDGLKAGIARLQGWIEANRAAGRVGAAEAAAQASKNAREIYETSESFQRATADLKRAGLEQSLAESRAAQDEERRGLEISYQTGALSLANYLQVREGLERKAINAKEAMLNEEIALERKRVVSDPVEEQQRRAQISRLQTQRVEIVRARRALADAIADGALQPDSDARYKREIDQVQNFAARESDLFKSRQEALNRFRQSDVVGDDDYLQGLANARDKYLEGLATAQDSESQIIRNNKGVKALSELAEMGSRYATLSRDATAQVNQAYAQADQAAAAWSRSQALVNQSMSASLIADAEQRASAMAALDIEAQQRQVSRFIEGTSARQEAEGQLADYIVLRSLQLAEDVKPEWQKMSEEWQNTTRLMRGASDEFMTGFVNQGREDFVQWAKTGKVNAAGLVDFIETKFLELAYKKYLAQSVTNMAEGLFGGITKLLGFGSTAGSSVPLVDLGLGGGRAAGGPVAPNTTYLIGEKGPELLRMGSQSGVVIPNHEMHRELADSVGQANRAGVMKLLSSSAERSSAGSSSGREPFVTALAGARADGGAAEKYKTYLVGEAGPELLRMPGTSGPGLAAAGSDAMQLTINTYISGNGVTRNELINGMALATDAAVAKVAEARRRGNSRFG